MSDAFAQDFKKVTIEDIFGHYSFSKGAQEKYLPSFVYKAIQNSVENHETPSREVVEGFAAGLLRWALERGATHFTHWFVPINGRSAQKHDSFIKVIGDRAISSFSGEILSMGEPDGSSFPSGGLRSTHEARGYTIWDPSSPPFIINHRTGATLYIPTVFCSWKGHPLDEKLPLKMASEALSEQALRLLTAAGDESHNYIVTNSGVEQEFFLVDSDYFLQRPDLMQTGRTLVGAPAAKGQQLEDHYFGDLTERTMRLINDAERELWKLGIPQTTRHKEVAPGQYEMAPVFRPSSIASDNNIITMEVISRVAHHYGMEALFHEKPFKGLNGSGKHNNWSIGTDLIPTVFTPGPNPQSNRIFMLFLAATLRAVDLHADLLRVAIASSANDHRLGAAEAPPAIISAYLGDEVNGAMEAFINKSKKPIQITPCVSKTWDVGIARGLPEVERHATDRNRTSPFAFTGNKFEFRAVGGSQTPHRSNYIINTIVADACSFMADEIERRSQGKTKEERGLIAEEVAREVLIKHKRVVFNGNAYSEEWHKEAANRGLPNLKTTPEALETLVAPKNIELFRRLGVFKEETLRARQAAWLEEYIMKITIEANSFLDIINTRIHPAVSKWINEFSETVNKATAVTGTAPESLKARLVKIIELSDKLLAGTEEIEQRKEAIHHLPELLDQAKKARELVGVLDRVRGSADALERLTPVDKWPLPSYAMMLFAGQTQNLNRFVKD